MPRTFDAEERQRISERMKAMHAKRKAAREVDVAMAIDPDFISLEEQAIAALLPPPGRADGLALAPTGMFDVARYHRLKKFYAKRKAAAQSR